MASTSKEIHSMLGFIGWFNLKILTLEPVESSHSIVRLNPNTQTQKFLRRACRIYEFYYVIHFFQIWYHWKCCSRSLTDSDLVYLMFQYALLFCGFTVCLTIPNNSDELVEMINQIFTVKSIRVWPILRIFMRFARIAFVTAAGFFTALTAWNPYNPWTYSLQASSLITNRFFLVTLKLSINIYEAWTFSVFGGYAVFVFYHCMFCAYSGIYKMAKDLEARHFPLDQGTILYKQLLIRVTLINACFQKVVSVSLKGLVLPMAVICGAILITPTTRDTINTWMLVILGYLWFSCFIAISYGYHFPGRANYITATIISHWRYGNNLWYSSNRFENRFRKMVIISLQPARLRFGAVSYYCRGTSVVIANFLFEKTISLSLIL